MLTARVKVFAARRQRDVLIFETEATLALRALYPNAPDGLRRHLAKSMTNRFARLLYWKSHDEKLRSDRRHADQSQPISLNVPEEATRTFVPEAAAPDAVIHPVSGNPNMRFGMGALTTLSETEPSTPSKLLPINLYEKRSPRPAKEGGASSVQISKLQYPRPPKAAGDRRPALCPFCRKMHEGHEYDDNSWWR